MLGVGPTRPCDAPALLSVARTLPVVSLWLTSGSGDGDFPATWEVGVGRVVWPCLL